MLYENEVKKIENKFTEYINDGTLTKQNAYELLKVLHIVVNTLKAGSSCNEKTFKVCHNVNWIDHTKYDTSIDITFRGFTGAYIGQIKMKNETEAEFILETEY